MRHSISEWLGERVLCRLDFPYHAMLLILLLPLTTFDPEIWGPQLVLFFYSCGGVRTAPCMCYISHPMSQLLGECWRVMRSSPVIEAWTILDDWGRAQPGIDISLDSYWWLRSGSPRDKWAQPLIIIGDGSPREHSSVRLCMLEPISVYRTLERTYVLTVLPWT